MRQQRKWNLKILIITIIVTNGVIALYSHPFPWYTFIADGALLILVLVTDDIRKFRQEKKNDRS